MYYNGYSIQRGRTPLHWAAANNNNNHNNNIGCSGVWPSYLAGKNIDIKVCNRKQYEVFDSQCFLLEY